MRRFKTILPMAAAIAALLFLAAGCMTPAPVNTAPAASAAAISAAVSAAPSATAAPTASAKATKAPAATAKTPATDAFKFYKLIDIGMTKDAVDKKLGVAPKAATSQNDPPNSFYYTNTDGNGVYVQFDKGLKLTDKTVQYTDPAKALTPYTSKPVTSAECDKITNGMKHADVVKLLGSEGAECGKTQSIVFGKTSIGTIYRWGNPDGSFIQVVFLSSDTASNAMFFEH